MMAAAFVAAPKDLATVDVGQRPSDPSGEPSPGSSGEPTDSAPEAENYFEGVPVSNARGTYHLAITVEDGEVTDVTFLEAGTSAAESLEVNAFALPELKERILTAQTWDVEHVSGASFTSPAMVESAQAAFDAAGLD